MVAEADTGRRVAVVTGAGGTVGSIIARTLVTRGWEVVGLSRRPIDLPGVRWIGVDLNDAAACDARLGELDEATHLFCAARVSFAAEGGREALAENLAIVRHPVETLDRIAPGLRHVHLVQGSKYYGSHVGPYPTPAREDDARNLVPNFYYVQQDYLTERQAGARWAWSVSRPDTLIHGTPGAPRNLVSIIATYAHVCRAMGLPFSFPGTPDAYRAIYQCSSAEHLAEGIAWMAEAPAAANNAYNMVNGDYFRWCNLWPVFARYFDVPIGPVRTISLVEAMADKAPVWDAILARHGLDARPFTEVARWEYGDYIWSRGFDVMSAMTKARLHGFYRTVDTQAEFLRYFDDLRSARAIP